MPVIEESRDPTNSTTLTVLLVEDNPLDARLLLEYLDDVDVYGYARAR